MIPGASRIASETRTRLSLSVASRSAFFIAAARLFPPSARFTARISATSATFASSVAATSGATDPGSPRPERKKSAPPCSVSAIDARRGRTEAAPAPWWNRTPLTPGPIAAAGWF